jgi:hypothetical protein
MTNSFDDFGPDGMGIDELSDDDLDLIAGGIPLDGRDPGFGSAMARQNPTMHAARTRPTDDANLWY